MSRLFHSLAGNAMIKGAALMADGQTEYTVYTGGFSAATSTYYMNTYEDPAIKAFPLAQADLDGNQPVVVK